MSIPLLQNYDTEPSPVRDLSLVRISDREPSPVRQVICIPGMLLFHQRMTHYNLRGMEIGLSENHPKSGDRLSKV